jgi:hypothetical protein
LHHHLTAPAALALAAGPLATTLSLPAARLRGSTLLTLAALRQQILLLLLQVWIVGPET